ncbi:MAG: zinc-ribbon domain containing protein [Chloroflexi bacterium]|nr:zinc-ribbon domain containing protein [Chloroflexota bacterium]
MELQDKTMTCRDCGREFTFTKGEQEFYQEKGFKNEPSRCPDCRSSRKRERGFGGPRRLYDVTCDECGAQTQVPFEPRQGRPVYCRDCFAKMNS